MDFAPVHTGDGQGDAAALRNAQSRERAYRALKPEEIERLEAQGNFSADWDLVKVAESFDVARVRNCVFQGLVRIGAMTSDMLDADSVALPIGLYQSFIVSSDIGENCAIHNVAYLARFLVGDHVLLLNNGELTTTPEAHFGQGMMNEDSAPWIDVWNESGGRRILPFASMRPSDAWFWAYHRGDTDLQERLVKMAGKASENVGPYSMLGDGCRLRNTQAVRNVQVGESAQIDGAACIENVTLLSQSDDPVRVGAGVDLRDGVVGCGSRLERQSMANRFVLGQKVTLDLGARIDHAVIGDCSTVECGEIRNALCFGHYGQHHNTGFLIAACIEGQCNLAAGATVGSNHNSRRADGEIQARRGFWPGLNTSFKHNCRFASFTLAAKGDYPAEIDLRLPFSLMSNDLLDDSLNVLPAFSFLHNMYALARNAQKFTRRDNRTKLAQHIETAFLAPDTVEEMFGAMALLEEWTARAWFSSRGENADEMGLLEIRDKGCSLLLGQTDQVRRLEVRARGLERSNRAVRIHRPERAYRAYREMIQYYSVRTLLEYMDAQRIESLESLKEAVDPLIESEWMNVGGQLLTVGEVNKLRAGIQSGRIGTWERFHAELDELWRAYPAQKAAHAMSALMRVSGLVFEDLEAAFWRIALDRARVIQNRLARLVRESRAKDYDNPFRRMSYPSPESRDAVVGALEDDPVIRSAIEDGKQFIEWIDRYQQV